ncbi:hypothetical protein DEIPH_ctg027orf0012 [Deinococcus phoenicis]|uniref:Uncharacterized protein n=1 Tax=Deinococcus phoenicis TaxID=1476583 RepID=A0A016QQF2_9DEIO|nr:hypothetical protein [Deinococcus phoenicis]EYB68082.1 hypothetical protein DEIPH_ctg027orf0012 [Deinococcus phoenicis]
MRRALALLCLASGLALAGGGGPAPTELPPPPVTGRAELTALAVDASGTPVLAWTAQGTEGNRRLHAARLAAGAWTPLGGVLNEGRSFNAAQLTARNGAGGQVWLGWAEDSGQAHVDSYLMSGWDGQAWSDPAHYAVRRNLSDAGRSRAFAVLPDGTPTLAWTDLGVRGAYAGVVRPLAWQAGTWVPQPLLSDPARAAFSPDLALNRAGRRTVAFLEGDFATMNVRVRQEDPSGHWTTLGGPLNRHPGSFTAAPRLALAADGSPVVTWIEEEPAGHDRVNVSRWTGTRWQPLGGPVSRPGVSAEAPVLALSRAGHPVLAWLETGHLRAARWTGTDWVLLPLPATHDASGPSLSPDGRYLAVSDGGRVRVWRLP